jgi:uncharacterized protein YdeI (YjbR/CyaY-like superfamily)
MKKVLKHDSYPHLTIKTPGEFEDYLKDHYDKVPGIWLKIAKKGTGVTTVTYDEALLIALCYGWIDGQVHRIDETYFIQKFTPRTKKSPWSQRNVGLVKELIKSKKMRSPGLKAIAAAKADGRWEMAYGGSKDVVMPEDFLKELKKDKQAYEFYQTLNKTNLFSIYYRLQTAVKPETRDRRMKTIVESLKAGKKLY